MSLLTSCSQVISSCPQLVEYSKEDRTALQVELASVRPDGQIVRFLSDYTGLRDQVRACQN